MKILIFKNRKDAVEKAVSIISDFVRKKPNGVLGLATGKTMIPLYKELVKRKLDFSKIKTVNIDEYANTEYRKSFRNFMDKYFFNPVNIHPENIYFPNAKTKRLPRVDLQILGIGRNGHIGFNEPGSKINSGVRKVKLARSTVIINKLFGEKYAYTLGIKNILNAKKIILLAFGKEKAAAVQRSVEGEISKEVPASFLRKHKNAIFILDKKAAGKLKHTKT